jgi:MFS family permease
MFRALRHRNFQLFFGGQLISLIGTWMQTLAQAWLVYRMTHSAVLLGSVAFASQIPVLFLGPLAGIVADRHRRYRIVIATQAAMMIQAFLMAALTLTHVINVAEIFALAFMLGVCTAYDIPARQSFLVEMVGPEDLMNAIALNSSMFNSARIVGPAIAGLLVAALGEGMCFLLNGLSFIAVIGGLLLMKIHSPRPNPPGSTRWQQLKEGMQYAYHNVAMRSLLLLLGVISMVGMSYMVLMPIFADKVLHHGARGLGLLMTATGFGALLAALWLARRRHVHGLDRVVAWCCAGFGVTLVMFGLSRNFVLSLVILVPAGFTLMVQMAATNTLIQSIVSDGMRGRVMGLYTMMFLGMAPFGSLWAGFLAQHFGAPTAIMFGGFACIVSAAVFFVRLRHLKIDDHLPISIPESPPDAIS